MVESRPRRVTAVTLKRFPDPHWFRKSLSLIQLHILFFCPGVSLFSISLFHATAVIPALANDMAPHAIDSMPSGQCVRLMSEKFIHKSDINQITPRMDQGGFGHPCILLKRSHDGSMALIALISSFGCSSRGTAQAPWGRPDLRKIHPDKTVFRAAANCNSERPDPSRPFIQLQHGIHFNFPTWIDENKQLTRESLSDLLAHMRQAAPQRWRDVNNAMVTTATTTASGPSLAGLQTPPSTPLAPSFAGNTDKRKRRTSSPNGEKDCKVQKVEEWRLSAGPVGQCCGGVVKEEGDGGQWCTVVQKRKRGKK
ncbi:hypothetical protein QC762_600325 [Podospora pseudocomata]|uniref:Uncharacterized protein n=1 Tax=Podospora pseudocomata TaxID=2093779 RepID=A0ABR0G7U5_9PEZI|nr:hypothetical protein QC762_600325 [Podospora pseudocomata]